MSSVILLSGDLIFISKVKEAAASVGKEVTVARALPALVQARDQATAPGVVIIDLEKCGVSREALAGPIGSMVERGWKVVSYLSHVNEDLAAEAEALELGEVVSRSQFVRMLPQLVAR